jgi:hypothetical protein
MPGYDPFESIYANTERLRQLSANQMAGRAYAAGDYTGATNALATSGDLQGAQTLTGNRQNEQLRAAQMENFQAEAQARQVAAQKAQRQEQLEKLSHVAGYLSTVHRSNGDVAKAIDSLAPTLDASPDQLEWFKKQAVDNPGIFDVISGNAAKELEPYTLSPGQQRYRGDQLLAAAPEAQKAYAIPAGGSLAVVGGGGSVSMTPGSGVGPAPPPNVPGATPGTVAPQDRDALIQMVAGEAGGEPTEGMAGVAHVALNRLSQGFRGAKSLTDVVNSPHQFEAISRGVQPSPAALQKAAQVVDAVLAGQIPDPTGGAINYLNPELQAQLGRPQPVWAPGDGQRIGRHVFYGGGAGRASAAAGNGGVRIIQGNPKVEKKEAPSGYRWNAAGNALEPIPGGPAATQDEQVSYSPDAINLMAESFLTDKKLPAVGMGKAGAAARTLVVNRAAEIAKIRGLSIGDINAGASSLRADSAALSQLTKTAEIVDAAETTATKAADFVVQGISGGGGTRFPLLNKAIIAGKRATGDPAADIYVNRLGTFVDEYSKVISGGTGAAAVTDSVRKEASRRLGEASSPEQLRGVLDSMKQEMQFRSNSLRDGIDTIHGRIQRGAGPVAPQINSRPRGWTRVLTPEQREAVKPFLGKGMQDTGERSNPYVPATKAQYDRIPAGKWFIDQDGRFVQKGAR